MKYRMVLSGTNDLVEVHTDHKYPVKLNCHGDGLSVEGVSGQLVYRYHRLCWTYGGMVRLFKWLQSIDDTATPEDILEMARMRLDPVDVLRIYAEANEETWHT